MVGGALGATAGGVLGSLGGTGSRDDLALAYERSLGKGALLVGISCTGADSDWIEQSLAAILRRVDGRPRPRTLLVFGREPGTLRNMYASGGRGFW